MSEYRPLNDDGTVARVVYQGAPAVLRALPPQMEATYRALRTIRHPGLAEILDIQTVPDGLLVYERYVEGKRLSEAGPLSPEAVAEIGQKLCQALWAVHEKGIVHRDIKPENVLLRPTGEVVLIDFGIARQFHEKEGRTDTEMLGTRGYAAPEQYGFAQSGPRTDVYAVGTLMLALLGGADGGPLMPVIDRCRKMEPGARYADAGQLARALGQARQALRHPSRARDALRRLPRFVRAIPGFRRGNPWCMLVAVLFYALFVLILLEPAGAETWLGEVGYALLFAAGVAPLYVFVTNAGGLRDRLPGMRQASAVRRRLAGTAWLLVILAAMAAIMLLA